MGNQCCQQGSNPGFIRPNFSKFQYTFQEDCEEMANPVLRTSNFAPRSLPNEFSDREECEVPRVGRQVVELLSETTLASMASPETDRGERDGRCFRFRRSGSAYVGEWKNSVPHGLGTLYLAKGSVYIGTFLEGVPFGRGRLIMASGAYYEGEIKYGKANGLGQFHDRDYSYRGEFQDDLKHGEGEERGQGFSFKGSFEKGERVMGTYKYGTCIYKGEFEDDEFSGQGELQNEDGSVYKGSFRNGKFHGYGQFKWADGSQYRGYYARGERQGDGQFFNSRNSSISKGVWSRGTLRGQGEYRDHRGKVTRCIWQNGRMTGIKTK